MCRAHSQGCCERIRQAMMNDDVGQQRLRAAEQLVDTDSDYALAHCQKLDTRGFSVAESDLYAGVKVDRFCWVPKA